MNTNKHELKLNAKAAKDERVARKIDKNFFENLCEFVSKVFLCVLCGKKRLVKIRVYSWFPLV